jgi:hypothetical protein
MTLLWFPLKVAVNGCVEARKFVGEARICLRRVGGTGGVDCGWADGQNGGSVGDASGRSEGGDDGERECV